MNAINFNQYKLKIPIVIRFADFDLLSHVNNANYLTYLEEARIKYFSEVIERDEIDWRQNGMILARMEIDFRKPITGYQNYFVYIRCSRLGNNSGALPDSHRLRDLPRIVDPHFIYFISHAPESINETAACAEKFL